MVHRSRRQEERLYEHGDAGQDRGHAIDALTTIAIAVAEGDATGYQGIDMRGIAPVAAVVERTVQGTDILASEALDNQYHDVLLGHGNGVGRNMDGGEVLLHLLITLEILGHDKHGLADGTVKGEGRVKHQRSLDRTIDILVGIADGDGAHGCSEAATDACHHEGCHGSQGKEGCQVVVPPGECLILQPRHPIEAIHSPHDDDKQDEQIDMADGLRQEDASQVLFVGELVEHRRGGASHGEAKIDGIAEVDSQRQTVDHQEDGTAELLINGGFLVVNRKEHQNDIGDMGNQDGTGVENQAAP